MEGSPAKRPYRGRFADDPFDRALAELAFKQHGVVGLWQLVELGLTTSAVRGRVSRGRLHAVHRSVYAVGHSRLTREGRFMAAVLACGAEAVLSHRPAAAMRSLGLTLRAWVDVTAPGSRRNRRGIRVHGAGSLAAVDRTVIDGIPVTSLARTLLDVCEDATRREVERAIDRAEARRLLDMAAIDDVLARADGRRGAAVLRSVLAQHRAGSTSTRSELEEAFLRICRAAGLMPDAVNAWIPYPDGGGAEGDFLWRRERLIVEVDGRDVHTTRRAFEHDRRRDQQLATLGYRVIRFTWRQIMFEPEYVAATLRALLSAARAARRPAPA
jgi:predicted transcriptional regulator of viral defense system